MSEPAEELTEDKSESSGSKSYCPSNIDFNFILSRAKKVLTDPKGAWGEIKEEALAPKELYFSYVLVLAAIPPLATYIGMVVFGVSMPFSNMTYRWPIFGGLVTAVVQYGVSLAALLVFAFIIEKLGPTFKASPSFGDALRLSAFAMTPGWVGGALGIIPMLSILGILFSIYGLYVLYVGFPTMTGVPEEGTLKYFAASVVLSIIAMFLIGLVAAVLSPVGVAPSPGAFSTRDGGPGKMELPGGVSIDMDKLQESMKQLEGAVQQQSDR